MDDFVWDFERQAGEEVEYAPRRDATPTAVPQARALGVPLRRKQSGAHPAQVVEEPDGGNEGEHVLEENEASDDELEVELPGSSGHGDHCQTAQSRSGPSETVLSETSVI